MNQIRKIFAIYVKISAVQNIAVAQLEHFPGFHLETAGRRQNLVYLFFDWEKSI
jgi:hypothetical protein